MALIDVFQGIPDIMWNVFDSVKLQGNIIMKSNDDGWDDVAPVPDEYPVEVLRTDMGKIDLEKTSFHEHVQLTDTIALVKGKDITVPLDTADAFEITDRFSRTQKYEIVAFDVDAADALYILLLRNS